MLLHTRVLLRSSRGLFRLFILRRRSGYRSLLVRGSGIGLLHRRLFDRGGVGRRRRGRCLSICLRGGGRGSRRRGLRRWGRFSFALSLHSTPKNGFNILTWDAPLPGRQLNCVGKPPPRRRRLHRSTGYRRQKCGILTGRKPLRFIHFVRISFTHRRECNGIRLVRQAYILR